jgi:hypothetical protein
MRIDCPTCGEPNIARRCAHDDSFVVDVSLEEVLQPARELLRSTDAPTAWKHRPTPS